MTVASASVSAPVVDPRALHALALALADDPFYRAVSVAAGEHAGQRAQLLEAYFQLALDEAAQVGEVHSDGADGAALWLTPEAGPRAIAAAQAVRSQALQPLLGLPGYQAYTDICSAMAAQVPAALDGAWYLSILGVHPAARGQGLARRLLASTLARADRVGAASYLETFNPLSLPFYERLGFGGAVECREPVTGRAYWLLVRQPE